jgi:hypothetical protein
MGIATSFCRGHANELAYDAKSKVVLMSAGCSDLVAVDVSDVYADATNDSGLLQFDLVRVPAAHQVGYRFCDMLKFTTNWVIRPESRLP